MGNDHRVQLGITEKRPDEPHFPHAYQLEHVKMGIPKKGCLSLVPGVGLWEDPESWLNGLGLRKPISQDTHESRLAHKEHG